MEESKKNEVIKQDAFIENNTSRSNFSGINKNNEKIFDNSFLSNEEEEKKTEKNESEKKEQKEESNKKENSKILTNKSFASSKHNSSKRINSRYSEKEIENKSNNSKKDEEKKNNNENNENNEFISTGKFMQINPHFRIFHKQINSLRDSIYQDTKRCLLLKGSLQESSNLLEDESTDLIKDIVSKIYDLRDLLNKGSKGLKESDNEVNDGLLKLKEIQKKSRKEIIECEKRINVCESQIGYKLLGHPSYSFMKKIKIKNV